jgi:hypothetical protein
LIRLRVRFIAFLRVAPMLLLGWWELVCGVWCVVCGVWCVRQVRHERRNAAAVKGRDSILWWLPPTSQPHTTLPGILLQARVLCLPCLALPWPRPPCPPCLLLLLRGTPAQRPAFLRRASLVSPCYSQHLGRGARAVSQLLAAAPGTNWALLSAYWHANHHPSRSPLPPPPSLLQPQPSPQPPINATQTGPALLPCPACLPFAPLRWCVSLSLSLSRTHARTLVSLLRLARSPGFSLALCMDVRLHLFPAALLVLPA